MKKKQMIDWHPSTESPGKRRFVAAYIKKGRSEDKITFQVVRYLTNNVVPCETHQEDNPDELCVAWADYKQFIKGITTAMIASAKAGAWSWWNEKEVKNEQN